MQLRRSSRGIYENRERMGWIWCYHVRCDCKLCLTVSFTLIFLLTEFEIYYIKFPNIYLNCYVYDEKVDGAIDAYFMMIYTVLLCDEYLY